MPFLLKSLHRARHHSPTLPKTSFYSLSTISMLKSLTKKRSLSQKWKIHSISPQKKNKGDAMRSTINIDQ